MGAAMNGVAANRAAVNTHITRILAYSAMKIIANFPPLYSVLNPDTSSLSPSAKSNGARFVSASVVTNQERKIGSITTLRGTKVFEILE